MYAVTGASGQLGRLVVKHLLTLVPADRIIAMTRNPEGLAELAARGVVVRRADFSDPASLPAAFEGATRLLIISTDTIGQRVEQHKAAIDAAARAGVGHIVYTSCLEPDANSPYPIQREHGLTEEALAASGVAWTALRNSYYAEVLPGLLNILRAGDHVLIPDGSATFNWVTREDCARTAAFVLAGKADFSGPADVTGPETLSLTEIVQRWSSLSGQAVTAHVAPDEELFAQAIANGVPEQFAPIMVGIAIQVSRQGPSIVANTVERATGTKPAPVDVVLSAPATV